MKRIVLCWMGIGLLGGLAVASSECIFYGSFPSMCTDGWGACVSDGVTQTVDGVA